jgi:hypothetical protein
MYNLKLYWLRLINLHLHWYGDLLLKMGDGDKLRSLLHTYGMHKSGQISISDFYFNMTYYKFDTVNVLILK